MKALAADGYLLDTGTKRLVRKQDLVDQWTRAYATRFRRQQLIGRFAADRPISGRSCSSAVAVRSGAAQVDP